MLFMPLVTSQKTNINDCVLFKLDINLMIETRLVNHLLSHNNAHLDCIDKFVFKHYVGGNYLMSSFEEKKFQLM